MTYSVFTVCGFDSSAASSVCQHRLAHFPHARERGKLAEIACGHEVVLCEELVDLLAVVAHIGERAALQRFGHERRRCDRYRAPAAFESEVGERVALDVDVELQPIATERIVAFRAVIRRRERAEIARPPVVIDDHIAIEILEVHQANTACARVRAATRRSTSARVL
jgi:hypothetical protein